MVSNEFDCLAIDKPLAQTGVLQSSKQKKTLRLQSENIPYLAPFGDIEDLLFA